MLDEGWGIWTGGVGSKNITMLVAVVTGGFHSVAKYSWAKDNIPLEEDMYPVIYATSVGEYTCSIDMDKYGVSLNFSYSVTNGE